MSIDFFDEYIHHLTSYENSTEFVPRFIPDLAYNAIGYFHTGTTSAAFWISGDEALRIINKTGHGYLYPAKYLDAEQYKSFPLNNHLVNNVVQNPILAMANMLSLHIQPINHESDWVICPVPTDFGLHGRTALGKSFSYLGITKYLMLNANSAVASYYLMRCMSKGKVRKVLFIDIGLESLEVSYYELRTSTSTTSFAKLLKWNKTHKFGGKDLFRDIDISPAEMLEIATGKKTLDDNLTINFADHVLKSFLTGFSPDEVEIRGTFAKFPLFVKMVKFIYPKLEVKFNTIHDTVFTEGAMLYAVPLLRAGTGTKIEFTNPVNQPCIANGKLISKPSNIMARITAGNKDSFINISSNGHFLELIVFDMSPAHLTFSRLIQYDTIFVSSLEHKGRPLPCEQRLWYEKPSLGSTNTEKKIKDSPVNASLFSIIIQRYNLENFVRDMDSRLRNKDPAIFSITDEEERDNLRMIVDDILGEFNKFVPLKELFPEKIHGYEAALNSLAERMREILWRPIMIDYLERAIEKSRNYKRQITRKHDVLNTTTKLAKVINEANDAVIALKAHNKPTLPAFKFSDCNKIGADLNLIIEEFDGYRDSLLKHQYKSVHRPLPTPVPIPTPIPLPDIDEFEESEI